jgi:perosamine synthetase
MPTFIPLSVPHFQGNEKKYVTEAVESTWVSTAGKFVTDFENQMAHYMHGYEAVACQSGTAALHLSLIEAGVTQEDEVLIPTLTFIAPVNTIHYVGANPVFVDCDAYLNMDVEKVLDFLKNKCIVQKGKLINKQTSRCVKAILPVHIFGHPVNLEPILEVTTQHNIPIIEDATESLGSVYKQGTLANRKAGTIGSFGCLSFNGNKIITTGGGGMVLCQKIPEAAHIRHLSTQAKSDELYYIHDEVGFNYRMTNLQAALGLGQLEQLDEYIAVKRKNFEYYKQQLADVNGLSFIEEPPYAISNYWFYSLVIDQSKYGLSRDELMQVLSDNKIQARPIWQLNHLQKPYATCQTTPMDKAPILYERILNLPCSVNLEYEDIKRICSVIQQHAKSIG